MSKNIYGTKSIKFKTYLYFVLVAVFSTLVFILFVYAFETYFRNTDKSVSSHYALADIQRNFESMNKSAENYWKTMSNEELLKYNSLKETLDSDIKTLKDSSYSSAYSDDYKMLVNTVTNSYYNYTLDFSQLFALEDNKEALRLYYEKYQQESVYIDEYIWQLISVESDIYRTSYMNIRSSVSVYRIVILISFIVFLISITCFLIFMSQKIIKPVVDISDFSREIASGNTGISPMKSENNKTDEINTLMTSLNVIKISVDDMSKTHIENTDIARLLSTEKKRVAAMEKDLNSQKRQNKLLIRQATYDNLTQIFNRNAFEHQAKQVIADFNDNSLGALFVIDVDNFKSVNDTLGHQGGDEVLKSLARCLTNTLSDCGFAGRWGGDEFVGFISDSTDIEFIRQKAADLCCIMNKKFMFRGVIHDVSISIGICPLIKGCDLKSAYEYADEMLYDVKEMGRNNFKIYMNAVETSRSRRL